MFVLCSHITRAYGKGALVLCCMAVSNVFPILREDQKKLEGKSNFENYDTHYAPVVPRTQAPQEKNFDACQPGQTPMYHELVVFQQSQIIPMFIVHYTKHAGIKHSDMMFAPLVTCSWDCSYLVVVNMLFACGSCFY